MNSPRRGPGRCAVLCALAALAAQWSHIGGVHLLASSAEASARVARGSGDDIGGVVDAEFDDEVDDGVGVVDADADIDAMQRLREFTIASRWSTHPRRPELEGPPTLFQNVSIENQVTCHGERDVWLLVLDGEPGQVKVPHHFAKVPICLQVLRASGTGSFWGRRMQAVREYLKLPDAPKFVVVSDNDIVINPLSWSDVRARFERIATPEARVVMGAEQSCFFGHACNMKEAQRWLDTVRSATSQPHLTLFPNSQIIGERDAVLSLVSAALKLCPEDDQQAYSMLIAQQPTAVALDTDEQIFVSMSRGLVPRHKAKWTCNFGGTNTSKCGLGKERWGACMVNDRGLFQLSRNETWLPPPLLVHLNGVADFAARRGNGCPRMLGELLHA